jgi:predicted Zn-dependent peptidase
MVVCCVGDVDPEQAAEVAEEKVPRGQPMCVSRAYGKGRREPSHAVKRYTEKKMALARPMFQLGFKDTDFTTPYPERIVATKILLDILLGESSDFFERCYSQGLVDAPFALEYQAGSFYGMAICTNSADDPKETADRVLDELTRARGLDPERFERIKRKHLGRFIRSFNSIEKITHGQTELAFRGLDLFDMLQAYQRVTMRQTERRFDRIFRDDNYAVSAIKVNG